MPDTEVYMLLGRGPFPSPTSWGRGPASLPRRLPFLLERQASLTGEGAARKASDGGAGQPADNPATGGQKGRIRAHPVSSRLTHVPEEDHRGRAPARSRDQQEGSGSLGGILSMLEAACTGPPPSREP